jgi:hypothetical protein
MATMPPHRRRTAAETVAEAVTGTDLRGHHVIVTGGGSCLLAAITR